MSPSSAELLENRALLAAIVWDGEAGNGNWATAANWFDQTNGVNNVLPGVNDDVSIIGFTGTITSSANQTINSLTTDANVNILISAGTLTIGDEATDVSQIDGSLTLNGSLAGAGELNVRNLTLDGVMSGTGITNIPADGTLLIPGNGALQRTLNLAGMGTWTAGGVQSNTAGIFNILAGSVFDVRGNNTFDATVNNSGTIVKSQGTGTTTFRAGSFNNFSSVDVQTGTMSLSGNGTSNGDWHVGPNAVLELDGAGRTRNTTLANGRTISGEGTLRFTGGTDNLAGDSLIDVETLEVAGGSSTAVNLGVDVDAVHVVQSGGQLLGNGTIDVSGSMILSGGTHGGTGQTNIPADGTLLISGGSSLNRTLNLAGTGTLAANVSSSGTGVFNVLAGSVFDVRADILFDATVNNSGMIIKSQGTGTTTFRHGSFNNFSLVDVQTGTMSLSGNGTSNGDWQVGPNAVLELDGSHLSAVVRNISLPSGRAITGEGTLLFTRGTTNFAGEGLIDVATFDVRQNSTVNLNRDISAGHFVQSGGQLLGNGTIDVSGSMILSGGTHGGTGQTNIPADGTLLISGGSSLNRTLNLAGTGTLAANVSSSGTGVFNVLAGSVFDVRADILFDATVNNSGMIIKSLGTGTTTFRHGSFNNFSLVDVQTGTMSLSGNGTSNGDWHVGPNAVLELNGNHLSPVVRNISLPSGRAITGEGTLLFTRDTTNFAGEGLIDVATFEVRRLSTVNLNRDISAGHFVQSGGEINGSGDINVRESVSLTGGSHLGTGETNIPADGTLSLEGLSVGRTVNLAGTGTWTTGFVSRVGTGTFNVLAGAELDIRTDGSFSAHLNNHGTIVKSLGTGTTTFSGSGNVTNDAEIEVRTGTVHLSGTYSHQPGSMLTVSTANPLVNSATLKINQIPAAGLLTDATVVLDGPGTSIIASNNSDVFASLSNIPAGGRLELLNGRDLTPAAGNFQNDGWLTLGADSTLAIDGQYSQSADAQLVIGLGGDTASGQFGQLTATGAANLDGRFELQLVNGFGPTTGQSWQVMSFASRNGNFADVDGLYLGATQAFEVIENADNVVINALADANDLALDPLSITVTGSGVIGEDVTVVYSVDNLTSLPATGSWTDSVYLSHDLTLDPGDSLIGRIEHTGGVAGLGSYSESLTAPLPAVVPGDYRVIVVQDSRGVVPDQNRSDNRAVSTGTIQTQYAELAIGSSIVGTLSAGETKFFQVVVPPGVDVDLSAVYDLRYGVDLYVRFGQTPTLASFDEFASNQDGTSSDIRLSETTGVHYIMLRGRDDMPGGIRNYTLSATAPGFVATQSSPDSGSNVGSTTVTIQGANFTADTTVRISNGTTSLTASRTTVVDSNSINATFDLTGLSPGTFDIVVEDGTDSSTLSDAFTVTAGLAGRLETRISLMSRALYRRPGTIIVEYSNTGETDIPAPLLELHALSADVQLRIFDDEPFVGNSVQFLGINREGPAGILPPGSTYRFEVEFLADGGSLNQEVYFQVRIVDDPTESIDWSAFRDDYKPDTIDDEAWDAIYGRFVSFMDTNGDGDSTLGEYQQVLADVATYLSELGVYTVSIGRLGGFLLASANNEFPGTVLYESVDASAPAAGMPLWFQRSFLQPISRRYHVGPFGRGWTSSWDWQAVTDDSGNVSIATLGRVRQFFPAANGSYFGVDGEAGVLTATGAEYVLRETNGDVLRFDQTVGGLLHVQDRNGNGISLGYSAGRLTSLQHSNGDSFALEYDANGRIVKLTDHALRETIYSYDASGQYLLSVTSPRGTTQYSYETSGALTRHALTSVVDPDQVITNFEYDSFGRLTGQRRGTDQDRVTYSYGDLKEPGRLTVTSAATGASFVYLLNDQGAVEKATNPVGSTVEYDYDSLARLLQVETPGNFNTRYQYDDTSLATTRTNALGDSSTIDLEGTHTEITGFEDERDVLTTYDVDANGNVTAFRFADGSSEHFAYDAAGNVSGYTNRRGQMISFTYNSRGQVSREDRADGSYRAFTYDDRGNLTSAEDPSGVISLDYDVADRLTRIEYPDGRFLVYTYNVNGRRSSLTDQDGNGVRYSYDSVGRLAGMTDLPGSLIVGYVYDSFGRLIREDRGNGTFSVYSYDSANRLTGIANHAPDSSINSSFLYTYDELGRRRSMTSQDGTTFYDFDAVGRLTRVEQPDGRTIEYQYDAVGRRLAVVDDGTTTNYVSNELRQYNQVGNVEYTYDSDGNLIRKADGSQVTTYAYDSQNRLTRINDGIDLRTYEYNALGHRVATTLNGVRTEFLIDPTGLINSVAEYDATGNLQTRYVHTDNGPVNRSDASGSQAYFDIDGTGSVVGLTDAAGVEVNQYSYLPFGEVVSSTETLANPYTFQGGFGVATDDHGLSYMRNRYYSAEIGSFTSIDPVRAPALEPYGYAANNPVQFVDPTGTTPFLSALEDRRRALENLADFGDDGLTQEQIDAVRCAGERVNDSADDFAREVIDNANPINAASPSGRRRVVRWLIGLGMQVDRGPNGSTARGSGGEGGGSGGAGGGGAGGGSGASGGGGGGGGGACCDGCGGGPGGDGAGGSGGTRIVGSWDPNDIIGPNGVGSDGFLLPEIILPYTIRFENLDTATAPAQTVSITQQLDTDLDFTTFELSDFGFGSLIFEVPEGVNSYSTRIDVTATLGVLVDVVAGINLSTGLATWTFAAIDPVTLDLPADPFLGFLPPNQVSPEGEGFVSYLIRAAANRPTGTRLDAEARIIFDVNDPIDTPAIFNTIDAGDPDSSVDSLPVEIFSETFTVSWAGVDDAGGSGIASYDVFVSENGGEFLSLLLATTQTSTTFAGSFGSTYSFYTVARDLVGFEEAVPVTADATTTLVSATLTADAGGPYAVDEGGTVVLAGSAVDGRGASATLTFEWDLDNDGEFDDATGQTPTFDASALDGPATFTVSLRVTSDLNVVTTDTASITVRNVAPELGADEPDETQASSTFLRTIDFTDPALSDVHTVTVNYGDGTVDQTINIPIGDRTFDLNHTFAADGTFTVSIMVTDDDGGSDSDSFHVTIDTGTTNTAPEITSLVSSATFEDKAVPGAPVVITGSFTDADAGDAHSATVDWGDGSPLETISVDQQNGTFAGSHAYANGGIFEITVTLSDGQDSTTEATSAVVTGMGVNQGVLQVVGSDRRDVVQVRRNGANIKVHSRIAGGTVQTFTVANSAVTSILIFACGGNDRVHVDWRVGQPTRILGGAGHDSMQAGSGSTYIDGGPGNDTLLGGSADDTLIGGSGHDIIRGGNGDDLLDGSSGNDLLQGGVGNDILLGGDGWDVLSGDSGRDLLIGGRGHDALFGGSDEDILIGSATTYDDDYDSLSAIRREWTSERSRQQRIANLTDGSGSIDRENGNAFLTLGTSILDDHVLDLLFGGDDDDWLFN